MNFSNLNKTFENKFKNHLNESVQPPKKISKFMKTLKESKVLTERNWQLTVPGSYRKAIMDAGEEEDYMGVLKGLCDTCDFVLEHLTEFDEDTEYVQEEWENFLDELSYIEIEDEDEANYWLNELYDLMDNTDIFLGIDESVYVPGGRYWEPGAEDANSKADDMDADDVGDEFEDEELPFESLNEEYEYRSTDKLHELDKEINDYLDQNGFHGFIDLYNINPLDEPVPSITYHINGDWKHDHLRFEKLVKDFLNSKGITHMITSNDYPSDSDTYEADYTIHLMKHEDDLDEGVDIESTGVNRMPLFAAKDAVDKFNQEAKKYPYWVIKTSKWYDPEGLNIENDNFNIQFAGEYNECVDWLSKLIDKAKADTDTYEIEEEGKDFVKLYYPHAISKAMFSIKKNDNIQNESLKEDYSKQDDINLIEPLINFFDGLENNYKCNITWNFGRRMSDGKMTAGVDVYFFNEEINDEVLNKISQHLADYGFELDSSLGYDRNPWKEHMMGKGYHTQIIENEYPFYESIEITRPYWVTFSFGDYSHESTTVYASKKSEIKKILQNQFGKDVKIHSIELDECLNEERKPKYWNSMFAQKVIDAYEKGDLTFDNIKEWDKNYNGGIVPSPPFNTGEILKYYLNHNKNLSEDTIKQNGKWVNKGKEGTHGTFKTKKQADAQRKAMFANGFKG